MGTLLKGFPFSLLKIYSFNKEINPSKKFLYICSFLLLSNSLSLYSHHEYKKSIRIYPRARMEDLTRGAHRYFRTRIISVTHWDHCDIPDCGIFEWTIAEKIPGYRRINPSHRDPWRELCINLSNWCHRVHQGIKIYYKDWFCTRIIWSRVPSLRYRTQNQENPTRLWIEYPTG